MRQTDRTSRNVAVAVVAGRTAHGDDTPATTMLLALAGLVSSFAAIGSVMSPDAVELLQRALSR